MIHSIPNSLNRKIQNGSKNPIPLGKEFTPNGATWVGYEPSDLAVFDVTPKFND